MTSSNSFQGQISMASSVSLPVPDAEVIHNEGKSKLRLAIMWIFIDIIITLFLITEECNLVKKIKITKLIIQSLIAIFIYILIFIFILTRKTILVVITKYSYIGIGSIYYIYKLILIIMYMIKNESDISNFDLVVFCITLGSIIPRIFGFYNAELYEQILSRVDESKRIEEHEKLLEKLGNKIDKGYSRWSNGLEISRQSREVSITENN